MRRNSRPTDPRILLYKERTASECMNSAIDFMRQNWRILLRYSLYILLPVCIIQTVGVVTVVDGILAQMSEPPIADLVTFLIFGLAGFVLLNTLLWTMVKLYHERPDGLATVTGKMIRKCFWPMLGRMVIAVVPIVLIMAPALVLATIVMVFVPFAFFAYMLVALPVLLVAPIYGLEEVSIFTAVKRAFVLGFRQLGILLLMAITLMVMVYVMQGIVMLPLVLLFALKASLSDPSTVYVHPMLTTSGKVLFNMFSVVYCYVSYLSTAVVLVSAAYLYGCSAQKGEDRSLISDIDNFENL